MSHSDFISGFKPVMEMLKQSPQMIRKVYCRKGRHDLERLLALCQSLDKPLELLEEADFVRVAPNGGHTAHQGVIALLAQKAETSLSHLFELAHSSPLPLILALDQVQDTGNLGTLCRTAWAFGIAGLLLPRHNSASLGAGAVRASAGTLARMPICIATNLARSLDEAEEQGFTVIGTYCGTADQRIINAYDFDWPLPAVLVLGNEDRGLRPGVLKRCQYLARIPFARKFDSINVAQAGGILMALCAMKH